jgi:hypothetical protein
VKTSSAKAKGRRLQQELVTAILVKFPNLAPEDVTSAIMGDSGMDVKLSCEARKSVPYAFECKNVEKINIWSAIDQAKIHAEKEKLHPAVVFKKNRSGTHVCISLENFLNLLANRVTI